MSSYPHNTLRDFDHVLEERGASRYYPRMDCDIDYARSSSIWMNGFLEKLIAD